MGLNRKAGGFRQRERNDAGISVARLKQLHSAGSIVSVDDARLHLLPYPRGLQSLACCGAIWGVVGVRYADRAHGRLQEVLDAFHMQRAIRRDGQDDASQGKDVPRRSDDAALLLQASM